MKKKILVLGIFIFALSSYSCVTNQAGSSKSSAKKPSWSQAVYCNIADAQVCAVAQSKEDCKKLGGKKVSTCPGSNNKK